MRDPRFVIDRGAGRVYFVNQVANPQYARVAIDGADAASFELLGGAWARDRNRVYWNGANVDGRAISNDPDHFERLAHDHARDRARVYRHGAPHPADAASVRVLSPDLVADGERVYWRGQVVAEAHGASFELLDQRFARDRARAFWLGTGVEAFPGSDGPSFAIAGAATAADRAQVYFDNVIAPRTDDLILRDPGEPSLDAVVAMSRPALLAWAIRKLHQSATAAIPSTSLRRSRFDPRRFSRARVLRQNRSVIAIFDQPIRFVPRGCAFVYARHVVLRLEGSASGPSSVSANPVRPAATSDDEFVPTAAQRAIVERVAASLPRPIGPRTMVEILDGDQTLRVQVLEPGGGEVFDFELESGRLTLVGPGKSSSYPDGVELG